jgi:hypothetical protein
MGMFDFIIYEDEQYQTKDTPNQTIANYKIEVDSESGDSYLWCEECDSEWFEDTDHWLGGHLNTWNHHWVRCNDFDGLIRFYREDEDNGGYKNDAWIEYKALFMNGKIIKLTRVVDEREN